MEVSKKIIGKRIFLELNTNVPHRKEFAKYEDALNYKTEETRKIMECLQDTPFYSEKVFLHIVTGSKKTREDVDNRDYKNLIDSIAKSILRDDSYQNVGLILEIEFSEKEFTKVWIIPQSEIGDYVSTTFNSWA